MWSGGALLSGTATVSSASSMGNGTHSRQLEQHEFDTGFQCVLDLLLSTHMHVYATWSTWTQSTP